MTGSGATDEPDGLPQRHCGRCRRFFAADPDLFFQTDWALCPECAEILLPQRSGGQRSLRPERT